MQRLPTHRISQLKRRRGLIAACLSAAVLAPAMALGQSAAAASYPDKPVRIVVGFPAGGAADILARLLSEKLGAAYKQPFVVENRAGAGGTIGAASVARAQGDGYTLLMSVTASQTIAPSVYKNLPYDPAKDFTAVAMVATIPVALVVNNDVNAGDVKSLIELARTANPPLAYGSSGVGAIPHLTSIRFQRANPDIELLHVPFKGSAPAMTELLAGRVQMMFDHLPSSLQHVNSGKLKALAIAGDRRAAALPDVPTLAEAGIEGVAVNSWFGLVAPGGVPAEIAQDLNDKVNALLAQEDVRAAIAAVGAEPAPMSTTEFQELIVSDTQKWAEVVRGSNIEL